MNGNNWGVSLVRTSNAGLMEILQILFSKHNCHGYSKYVMDEVER
jgi:hypothetical protein